MAEERRLRNLYNFKMAECQRLQNEIDRLSEEMRRNPQSEAELRPLFVERAREWQRLWAETRNLSLELEAVLRHGIEDIRLEIYYWKKREY